MSQGFRIAGTLNEFLADLDRLANTEHKVIIWQNDEHGSKKIHEGSYLNFTKESGDIIINLKLDKNEVFDKNNSVYIFEKVKGILFKGKYVFCVNSVLKVLADDRVFLKEKRSENRFVFNYTKVIAKIKSIHPGDSKTVIEDEISLRDVSADGYCIKMSRSRSKLMNVSDNIQLVSLGGIELPQEIEGKIVHISDFLEPKTKKMVQENQIIGIKFNNRSKLFMKVISVIKQHS